MTGEEQNLRLRAGREQLQGENIPWNLRSKRPGGFTGFTFPGVVHGHAAYYDILCICFLIFLLVSGSQILMTSDDYLVSNSLHLGKSEGHTQHSLQPERLRKLWHIVAPNGKAQAQPPLQSAQE